MGAPRKAALDRAIDVVADFVDGDRLDAARVLLALLAAPDAIKALQDTGPATARLKRRVMELDQLLNAD